MDLDWIILYDYMTIHSQISLKEKVNKFYESFYPLRLKKTGPQPANSGDYQIQLIDKFQMKEINREGLLGIIADYIKIVLTALKAFLSAEYLLAVDEQHKEQIRLSILFVDIEMENLFASLSLEEEIFFIEEFYKVYTDSKESEKTGNRFLQLKLLTSLKRLFEFYYDLDNLQRIFQRKGYQKLCLVLQSISIDNFNKASPYFSLYPEMSSILMEILKFFKDDEKAPFNFHSHLIENTGENMKKQFERIVLELFSTLTNKQKQIFVCLSDENFYNYLKSYETRMDMKIHQGWSFVKKETVQKYYRLEKQINSLIATEQNLIQTISVPEQYRGTPQWRNVVVGQMIKISTLNKKMDSNVFIECKKFKESSDFTADNFE